MVALFNRNPYEVELEELAEKYEKVAGNVVMLQKVRSVLEQKLDGLQCLVETLRQHLYEKDEMMKRIKAEYQRRIEEYNVKINSLQEKE